MTRPSAGKEGTHGCFMVEVRKGTAFETRVLARRFVSVEEARDFYTRTVTAHQQKANRERTAFRISCYETASAKSPLLKELLTLRTVTPL